MTQVDCIDVPNRDAASEREKRWERGSDSIKEKKKKKKKKKVNSQPQ